LPACPQPHATLHHRHTRTTHPGAVTWDTDDRSTAAAVKARAAAAAAAAAAAGGDAALAALAARPNPKAWYDQHHAKYKESAFSTGATARAFTSTVAVAETVSQRQLQRVDRNPTKKGEFGG
jgi:hypothetical protein